MALDTRNSGSYLNIKEYLFTALKTTSNIKEHLKNSVELATLPLLVRLPLCNSYMGCTCMIWCAVNLVLQRPNVTIYITTSYTMEPEWTTIINI